MPMLCTYKPSVTTKDNIDTQVSQLDEDRRGQEEDGDSNVNAEMEDVDAEICMRPRRVTHRPYLQKVAFSLSCKVQV